MRAKLVLLILISFAVGSWVHAFSRPVVDGGPPDISDREGVDRQSPEEISEAARRIGELFRDAVDPRDLSTAERDSILDIYKDLDPNHEVPSDLLETAVLYFGANKERFSNQDYISIIDYKPRSDHFRFFVINLRTGRVFKYRTSHGWGSDRDEDGVPEKFSNTINSGTSSIGFVRTAEVYFGRYKRSLRLDGLSRSNSNIRARAIVVHGWDQVHEAPVIQGLSWGCPALDWAVKDSVIDKIKEGSLIFMSVSNEVNASGPDNPGGVSTVSSVQ